MPYYRVRSHTLLIDAENPELAAMAAFRAFEDSTPHEFEVVGPETEIRLVTLSEELQDEAITINFGKTLPVRLSSHRE